MANLEHPDVVRYYSVFPATYAGALWFCIQMQLYERSLKDWFYEEEQFRDPSTMSSTQRKCLALSNRRMRLVVDVLHGLHYIHQKDLVHGDLHFGNIFLEQKADGSHAVIGDFGLSEVYEIFGKVQSSSTNDEGIPAAERAAISGTVTKSREKKSTLRHRTRTQRQNRFQKYNAGFDMQRFAEVYLQIRYLEDFDFSSPDERQKVFHAEYLLKLDKTIISFLAKDWEAISWRCQNILKLDEFHAFENQFSKNHKDTERVSPDPMHWESSMIPLIEKEETGAANRINY